MRKNSSARTYLSFLLVEWQLCGINGGVGAVVLIVVGMLVLPYAVVSFGDRTNSEERFQGWQDGTVNFQMSAMPKILASTYKWWLRSRPQLKLDNIKKHLLNSCEIKLDDWLPIFNYAWEQVTFWKTIYIFLKDKEGIQQTLQIRHSLH